MLTTSSDFTNASEASNRQPVHSLFVSWLRDSAAGAFFTIGVSSIGLGDVIKGDNNNPAESDSYIYDDETSQVISLEIDREFSEPVYSTAKALADVVLSNTTDRYTPGFDPDIGDAIKPQRPVKIALGFDYGSAPEKVQTFVGQISDYPETDEEAKQVTIHAIDYAQVIENYPLESTDLYLDKRTDELMDILLQEAGLATTQYVLDTGNVTIPYAFFPAGTKMGEIIKKLAEVEGGAFYVDENGVFHFETRDAWHDRSLASVALVLTDDLVLNEKQFNTRKDTIVNLVEVFAKPRKVVASAEQIFQITTNDSRKIPAGGDYEFFTSYDDPVYSVTTPTSGGPTSHYLANTLADGTGTNKTSQVTITTFTNFSQSTKVIVHNADAADVYLTDFTVYGRPAKVTQEIYVKSFDQTSIDEFGEQSVRIENDFIQSADAAQTLADNLVADHKDPASYRQITIRGNPAIQLGDKVERSGDDYFVLRIKTKFTASDGLVQELTIVKRPSYP